MKKLFLIFISMFSFVYGAVDCSIFTDKDERAECERMNIRESMSLSQATRQNEKRHFIGFEGGLSYIDAESSWVITSNALLVGKTLAGNFGYDIGLSIGHQRYFSKKLGGRLSFGIHYANTPNVGKFSTKAGTNEHIEKYQGVEVRIFSLLFAYDWLFDFVHKSSSDRFGMSLGWAIQPAASNVEKINQIDHLGINIMSDARLGFYIQKKDHIFDFMVNVPIVGFYVGKFLSDAMVPTTATIGYKYLFGE